MQTSVVEVATSSCTPDKEAEVTTAMRVNICSSTTTPSIISKLTVSKVSRLAQGKTMFKMLPNKKFLSNHLTFQMHHSILEMHLKVETNLLIAISVLIVITEVLD